jgi:hypothetical protein
VCKYSRHRYEYWGDEAVEEAEEGGRDSEAVGIQQSLTSLGRIIGAKWGHDISIISNTFSISIDLAGSGMNTEPKRLLVYFSLTSGRSM